MGAKYLYKCNECDYSISTGGLWEFYRDKSGMRKPYGHPCPISTEAEQQGISGFSAELYCHNCGKVRDLIIVEFKKPIRDSFSAWNKISDPINKIVNNGTVKCFGCSNPKLMLEPDENIEVHCPKCNHGFLCGGTFWISQYSLF